MAMSLGITDYVVIGLMLAISATVGVFFRFTGGKQKTTKEFLMAGKNMSIYPVAFSLMATYMSAISVLGLPAETYMYGTQFVMWLLGVPVGACLAAYLFVPVFFDMQASTAYEYLEKRFGKTTRAIVSILFIVQMILYMAVVLYAPSLALNAVTGLSTWASVITLAVVCTFYSSLGGLKAVLWTDVFQAMLMYLAIIAVVIKGSIDVGGVKEVMDIAGKGGRLIFFNTTTDMTVRYTIWNSIISGIVFSVNTFGTNQAQIQRMLSVPTLKDAQKALLLSVPLIIVFTVLCCWDGVVIYANFHDCDPMLRPINGSLTSPDQLMPYAILTMFNRLPGMSGLAIAGVFSASLSTISSAMNSLTAVTMEDFIRPYCLCKRLTESWAAFTAKIIAIAYGGICLVLTYVVANFRGVLEASNVMFGMVGGPVLGVFTLGMLTTTTNEPGLLIGLLSGFLLNAWMGFGSYAAKLKVPHLFRTIDGCPEDTNGTTFFYHNTSIYDHYLPEKELLVSDIHGDDPNRDVLGVYKISFMWFPIFSSITVLVVGYISSFLIGFLIEKKVLTPEVISPVMRKWHFGPPQGDNKVHTEMEVRTPIPDLEKKINISIIPNHNSKPAYLL